MENKTFVIALGGSTIHPDELNVEYLKNFYNFLLGQIEQNRRFILIIGGGAPARKFQAAAAQIAPISGEDKDWIGIHATRLNAHLLRTIFSKQAHPVILKRRGRVTDFEGHSIIIGAGWQPGWSTDFVAVQTAADFKTDKVLVLGKPDFVYDKDNQKFVDARPLPELNWGEYLKLIPSEWSPGMNAPVDPVAARLAQKGGLKVIVASASDLDNLKNILDGQPFRGTIIK